MKAGAPDLTHACHGQDPLWSNISDQTKAEIGANVQSTTANNDGVMWMLLAHFYKTFQTVETTPDLGEWKRSYFMALNEAGSLHAITVRSPVTQQVVLSVNVQSGDIYPRKSGCVDAYSSSPLNAVYTVNSPSLGVSSVSNTVGGNPSFWFNDGQPIEL